MGFIPGRHTYVIYCWYYGTYVYIWLQKLPVLLSAIYHLDTNCCNWIITLTATWGLRCLKPQLDCLLKACPDYSTSYSIAQRKTPVKLYRIFDVMRTNWQELHNWHFWYSILNINRHRQRLNTNTLPLRYTQFHTPVEKRSLVDHQTDTNNTWQAPVTLNQWLTLSSSLYW